MNSANNEHIAPWSRTIFVGDKNSKEQIKQNGKEARILEKNGFWEWTPEAQKFLALAKLGLMGNIYCFLYLKYLKFRN
jgi:hypothetical protein